jgi:hypothetical protein
MQKVVGSSPIIRFEKAPETGPFSCPAMNRDRAQMPIWKRLGNDDTEAGTNPLMA